MKASQVIFYLDDDVDDLYFFKDIAESQGHSVSIFIDGKEMLKAMAKLPQPPDVIFLDIHMPVFNGEEILQVIKKTEEWQEIPIVMISGAYPKKLVRQYLEAGASYLMKKTTIADLSSAVEQVLAIDWKNFQAYS